MTKRFNYHIDEVGVYYYVCDSTKKGDERIILEFDTKYDAIEVCNVLNSLNDENEQLKKENQDIQDKVMRLLDYVEVKQCVTRTEIKKWWNGDVE